MFNALLLENNGWHGPVTTNSAADVGGRGEMHREIGKSGRWTRNGSSEERDVQKSLCFKGCVYHLISMLSCTHIDEASLDNSLYSCKPLRCP